MQHDYDLFVIGGGSGGVRAARIAASHGARVALAEEYRVGGTCVIRGCVPKKLLVYAAQFADDLRAAARFGWQVEAKRFEWPRLRDAVAAEVTRLEGLYTQTLDRNRVEVFTQRASVSAPHTVQVGDRQVSAARILIATGARPAPLEIPGGELALSSNEMFHLERLPERLVVIGGGYIANEFACIFHALGSTVTVLNHSETLLRSYDRDLTSRYTEMARARGLDIRLNAPVTRIERAGERYQVFVGDEVLEADVVLSAIGRRANTRGLGLEAVGITLGARGEIPVDAAARTACPSIFAVGDVTDHVQLTPIAIREGHAFADRELGASAPAPLAYDCIPSAVFCQPPIAAVGLTETEARATYAEVKVYTSDFRPMKHTLSGSQERAFYKMICDGEGVVRGLHVLGPDAAEIVQAAAVAVRAGLRKVDFDRTVALHPTMAEELVLLR